MKKIEQDRGRGVKIFKPRKKREYKHLIVTLIVTIFPLTTPLPSPKNNDYILDRKIEMTFSLSSQRLSLIIVV